MIDLRHKIIFSGRQIFTSSQHTVILNLVNDALGVFQAHTHGNALGFDCDIAVVEHLIDVTGRVTCSQNNRAIKELASCSFHACHTTVLDNESSHPGLEVYLTSALQNGFPHRLDDTRQLVTADMGMGIDEDILSRPMLNKDAEHTIYRAAFLAAGVEFAIAIGTSPTLAKAVITLRVHHTFTLDARGINTAFHYLLAALQHNGFDSQFNEPQSSEQSARSHAHDNRLTLAIHRLVLDGRHQIVVGHWFVDIYPHLEIDHHIALTRIDGSF